MNKKIVISVILGAILLVISLFFAFGKKEAGIPKVQEGTMILFYSIGCPHCENVEKFLEENKNIEEKVKFEKREAGANRANANLMLEKAKKCNLAENEVGVPFFWDGEKCYFGDTPVIDFLKSKVGQ